uniref:Sushi domain containing 1 n=1 Tax=Pelusios castaneus TaxID=367368 RepID=A0A8C8RIR6_9SAUR
MSGAGGGSGLAGGRQWHLRFPPWLSQVVAAALVLAARPAQQQRGQGTNSSVPDVCATCHINATCQQKEGKNVCICNYGFVGNGRTHCQDKDECQIGASKICGEHTSCHNTHGSFYCICLEGYYPSNNNNKTFIPNDGTYCTDIDECQVSGVCGARRQCVNTIGSYKCHCMKGYRPENAEEFFHQAGNTVLSTGCGRPPLVPNTDMIWNNISQLGGVVHYRCKKGFHRINGKNTSRCTYNGSWEIPTLICKEVDCGIPPTIQHAELVWNFSSSFGSVVCYSCQEGFEYIGGNNVSVCEDDGVWVKSTLTCKVKAAIKNVSVFNQTCVKWRRSPRETDLKMVYLVRMFRVSPLQNSTFNFTAEEETPEVCLDLKTGTNYTVNVTVVSPETSMPSAIPSPTTDLLCDFEGFSNVSVFNDTCLKWRRHSGRVGVKETYLFRVLGRRWYQKEFLHEMIFNFTTGEETPEVCLELKSGANYMVNITTASSKGSSALITIAIKTEVKEDFSNMLILNDTCLKWRRSERKVDWKEIYSFHIQGRRWYQKEFFHEMTFNFTAYGQTPEVCLDLRPGTNYTVNISAAALDFSVLVSMTTQITDPPFPEIEFVTVQRPVPALSLRKAEDRNGPISFYQVIVLPLSLQSTFLCDSLAAATFFSNATDAEGYVAAEFLAKDVADNMLISLGDRRYYGTFYNAPLKQGKDYCVVLRIVSQWNKVMGIFKLFSELYLIKFSFYLQFSLINSRRCQL